MYSRNFRTGLASSIDPLPTIRNYLVLSNHPDCPHSQLGKQGTLPIRVIPDIGFPMAI